MCTTKYVVNRLMLGNRELGWELWNEERGDVIEMTSNEIKKGLLKGDPIYGLEIGADGELVLGSNFFTRNMMEHRHIENFKPMFEDDARPVIYFIVLGKNEDGKYDIITTRFKRTTFSEQHLRVVYSLGAVSAGMKMVDDKIVLPDLKLKAPKAEEKTSPVKTEAKKEVKKQ